MDSMVVAQVVEALGAIYSPAASNQARQLAEQFLEQVRDSPQAPVIGSHLARSDALGHATPVHVRHFGLGLLESTVKYKWQSPTYTDAERAAIQAAILGLCDAGLRREPLEEPVIVEKFAKIFVELAKRTWPTQWTDMDVRLRALYQESVLGRKLVLLIYKSLVEDVFIFEETAAVARKRELSTALMSVTLGRGVLEEALSKPVEPDNSTSASSSRADLVLLLSLVRADPENEGWLMRWSNAIEMLSAEVSAKFGTPEGVLAESLLRGTLDCVAVFMDWVALRSVGETRILYRLLQVGGSPSLPARLSAADCLAVLFSRNIHPSDAERITYLWTPLFDEGCLGQLAGAWMNVYAASSQPTIQGVLEAQYQVCLSEPEYVYLKRLAQAIAALGDYQVCFKRNTTVPQRFDEYMELVLLLLAHPSLIINGHAMSFLFNGLKHDCIRLAPMQPYLMRIADQLLANMIRRPNSTSSPPKGAAMHYARIDFDSVSEIDLCSSGTIQRSVEVLRLVVAQAPPAVMFEWLRSKCAALLGSAAPSPAECAAMAVCVDTILGAMPQQAVRGTSNEQANDAFKGLQSLLVQLIEYHGNQNSAIVVYQLQMIVAFSDYMDLYPDILFKCLEKFFGFVVYTLPSEQRFLVTGAVISDETRTLRRKAASSLVRLGTAMPDLLYPLLPQIMPVVSNLIETNQLMRIEQTLLIEFLVAIISGSSTPAETKRSALESVLSWDLQHFKATEPFAQSMDAFLTQSAMDAAFRSGQPLPEALSARLAAAGNARSMWSGTLNAVWIYMKRARPSRSGPHEHLVAPQPGQPFIWPELVEHVLPIVLATIKCIHGVLSPSLLARLPKEFGQLTRLTVSERASLLGRQHADKDADDGAGTSDKDRGSGSLDLQVVKICGWLGRMREICYQILSTFTTMSTTFYALPKLAGMLSDALFANSEDIVLQHWKSMISTVIRPLVLHCPDKPSMSAVLLPLLPTFFETIVGKLAATGAGGGDADDDEDEDVTDEIVLDKLLRDVTRVYADLWSAILLPYVEKGSKKKDKGRAQSEAVSPDVPTEPKQLFHHQDLVMFFFSNDSLIRSFMGTLSLLLTVKDTGACKRGLGMCMPLVPLFAKDATFHTIVGRDFLMAALQVLHDGYQKHNHNDAINLITDAYVQVRGTSSTVPFETLVSVPGMSADQVQAFETDLAAKNSAKERHLVVRALLKGVTGVEMSERFKKATSFVLNLSEKRIFAKPAPDLYASDILAGDDQGAPVVAALFDQHD
ncbi:armadillo-type protein [Entophlyctis helioformis]|nr:armadillo-type protein [Entophlyctis helioformis]